MLWGLFLPLTESMLWSIIQLLFKNFPYVVRRAWGNQEKTDFHYLRFSPGKGQEEKMRSYKMALLRREFRFLERLDTKPGDVLHIQVKRGDKNLLEQHGQSVAYEWPYVHNFVEYTKYFAICGEDVVELLCNWEHNSRSLEQGWVDSIGDQIFALGINPDYIVESVREDEHGKGQGENRYEWTIYKMAKFDLSTYHQKKIDEAAVQIKAEIEAACAEPVADA
jgi:hypothetical protein